MNPTFLGSTSNTQMPKKPIQVVNGDWVNSTDGEFRSIIENIIKNTGNIKDR